MILFDKAAIITLIPDDSLLTIDLVIVKAQAILASLPALHHFLI